jgi:hypothetical protein
MPSSVLPRARITQFLECVIVFRFVFRMPCFALASRRATACLASLCIFFHISSSISLTYIPTRDPFAMEVQVTRAVHQASFLLIFQDPFASLISDLPSGLPDEVSDRVAALGSFTFTTNVDVVLVRWFLQMERFFCVAAADRILLLLRARRFAFLATETMARWSRLRTWSSCSKLLRWRSVQLIHA